MPDTSDKSSVRARRNNRSYLEWKFHVSNELEILRLVAISSTHVVTVNSKLQAVHVYIYLILRFILKIINFNSDKLLEASMCASKGKR